MFKYNHFIYLFFLFMMTLTARHKCVCVCVPMLMENFLDIQFDSSCPHFPTYSFQN